MQTKVEDYIHRWVLHEILLLAHKQAVAWIDEWIDMSIDDVRAYERDMHEQTNAKMQAAGAGAPAAE